MLTFAGFKAGIRRLFGVAVFVVPFGIAFGTAAIQAGLSPVQAVAMSATVFAGAAQFATLELWREPLPLLSIALVAAAVNARHIIFGAALAPLLNQVSRRHRILSAFFLSDANFADMQSARHFGAIDLGILAGGGFMVWIAWVLGTILGVLVGGTGEDMSRFGIDVVMAAFFVTVIAGSKRRTANLIPMGIAGLASAFTVTVLPHGWNVIFGAVAGGLAGAILDR